MSPTLAEFILKRPFGFITDDDRRELLELDRLCPLVVRLECARFICAVQDLPTMLGYVRAGGGHLRDVSIHPGHIQRARECLGRDLPGHAIPRVNGVTQPWFNESDCGGAFDGNQVTSDADPGL